MLTDHRKASILALAFVGGLLLMLVGVGIHPTGQAPTTSIPVIGRIDDGVAGWIVGIRTDLMTSLMKALDILGAGIVTIPLRIAVVALLLLRRRVAAAVAFGLAWAVTEVSVSLLKGWYERGRPPAPLVETIGSSFPSGHSAATAMIAVGLVLVLIAPGARRRRWELLAVAAALVMGFSRIYLGAHWLSDSVTGVLLGASVTILSAALVVEVADRRTPDPAPEARLASTDDEPSVPPAQARGRPSR